jgi:AcrR family transcriptional regulator
MTIYCANQDILYESRMAMHDGAKILRKRGRPSSDDAGAVREEMVLGMAFLAFAERGYEGTTLREIAKALGVSHNLLNVRFGSKADLWRRAVDAAVAKAAPPVMAAFDAPGLDDEARLRELIHRFCRWGVDNPGFVGLTHIEGRRATWRVEYLVQAYVMPFKERLDALMEAVGRQRKIGQISSSALMAILVEGVGFYFASAPLLKCMHTEDEISPALAGQQVEALARFILAGLLP